MTLRIAMSACAFIVVMLLFGAVKSPWIIATIPAVTLTGLAFATPTAAWAATLESPRKIGALFKWVLMPLYLFSGTFFPISQLPLALRFLAQITPLWQGVALCRSLSLGTATLAGSLAHVGYLLAVAAIGIAFATRTYRRRLYG
jgi:lipooligosaccharide transport system permease protein